MISKRISFPIRTMSSSSDNELFSQDIAPAPATKKVVGHQAHSQTGVVLKEAHVLNERRTNYLSAE
jgi:hypothetical protein